MVNPLSCPASACAGHDPHRPDANKLNTEAVAPQARVLIACGARYRRFLKSYMNYLFTLFDTSYTIDYCRHYRPSPAAQQPLHIIIAHHGPEA